ncbi:MAG: ArdC-like ssDNA-binding domain-containing protein [Bacilli bacterium]|nr:ArdC-like ssDNA-binding domain-containing protein [Bacilli bacterium]
MKAPIEKQKEYQQKSLDNALNSLSFANYPAIIEGFLEKGIPVEDIKPRENIFTYNAWAALNRTVKKGEHGVKIVTVVKGSKKLKSGEEKPYSFPKTTTVFHISQTEELKK